MAEDTDGHDRDGTRPDDDLMSEAEIDFNVMGSFPASDPPSWTLGVGPHQPPRAEFEADKPSTHDPTHQNDPDPPA